MTSRPKGRPKVPLLSRSRVLQVALDIADTEGLEAVTTRRIAAVMGVKGASLYNHFASMEEILVGVAELAFTTTPLQLDGRSPVDYLVSSARQLRDSLLAHPAVAPVVVQQRSIGFGTDVLEFACRVLVRDGVPVAAVMPILDSLEWWVIGCVMRQIAAVKDMHPDYHDAQRNPHLVAAVSARELSMSETFDIGARGIVEALLQSVGSNSA